MPNRSTGAEDLPHFNSREAIVGWRGWNIVHPHFLFTNSTVWLPQERTEAFCTTRYHAEGERVPVENCSCGIYAFTMAHEVKEQNYTHQTLLGEVFLWGKVIEHSRGYKAEYAYPKKFYAKSEELYWEENQHNTVNSISHMPRDKQYEAYIRLVNFIAYRYAVPIEVVDGSSPIYVRTPEEEQRLADLERQRRLAIATERAQRRKKNEKMMAAAKLLPPTVTGMGFKSLWEQITWEADQAVADRLKGGKKPLKP